MSLYAIGDPHLSFSVNKPMDIFKGWTNYVERFEKNWKNLITDEDTVVLMGDISWAMKLEEAKKDFRFINDLPGRKIIMKGNHDYWWNTLTKLNEFAKDNSFDKISFLFNNSYRVGNISVCGSRGWFFDAEKDDMDKVILRESGRIRASIAEGRRLGGEPYVFLHYPPLTNERICQPIFDVLKEENITHCYYAHLHGASANYSFNGEKDGIKFELLSADYLKFCPKFIK